MMPGSKSGASRDRGLMQMAQRGLITGGPKTHEGGKVHTDAKSGDELPSYNVQTATHTASSKGDGKIKTGKDVGVSQSKVNAYNMKTYGTLTPTKDGLTNNTSSSSSKASTEIDSKKETLGDKTENQIKTDGVLASGNRTELNDAKVKHERNLIRKDSTDAANKSLDVASIKSGGYLTDSDFTRAQATGDKAGGYGAAQRAGFDGNLLDDANKPSTKKVNDYVAFIKGSYKNSGQIKAINKNVAAVSQKPKG